MLKTKKTTLVLALVATALLVYFISRTQLYNTWPHRTIRDDGSARKELESVPPQRSTVSHSNPTNHHSIDHNTSLYYQLPVRITQLTVSTVGSLRNSDSDGAVPRRRKTANEPGEISTSSTTATLTKSWPSSPLPGKPPAHCKIPQGGYKAWNQGVITALKPVIQRNCTKLFAGDLEEAERIKNASESWTNSLTDTKFCKEQEIARG